MNICFSKLVLAIFIEEHKMSIRQAAKLSETITRYILQTDLAVKAHEVKVTQKIQPVQHSKCREAENNQKIFLLVIEYVGQHSYLVRRKSTSN